VTGTGPATSQPRRWWRWVAIALAAAVLLLAAWSPSRVTFQTLALIPSLVQVGPNPLGLAPAPTHEVTSYTAPDGTELPADLWLPASASADRPVGAVILVSGINSQGRAHPALARIGAAMSRAGAAVMIPELPVFFAARVDATEVGRIVAAFQALAGRPEVDSDRIGIMGISVGGSLSLIAAADPAIADQVKWVGAFGAYADAGEIMTSVVSHEYRLDGQVIEWDPVLLVRQIVFGLVTEQVTNGRDHGYLYGAYDDLNNQDVHPLPDAHLPLTSTAATAAEAILLAKTLPQAEAALAAAPAGLREVLDGISPIRYVAGIRADVFLMHDVSDHHIPYSNSRELAAAMEAAGVPVHLGEFRLFDHVQPETADPIAAAPEIWKLFWFIRDIAAETL